MKYGKILLIILIVAIFLTASAAAVDAGIKWTFEKAIKHFRYLVLYDRTNGCYVNYDPGGLSHWVVVDQWGVMEYHSGNLSKAIRFLIHNCQP